jgi:hypothetical protein
MVKKEYTGILDMKGLPILLGDRVIVHDSNFNYNVKEGVVVFEKGSYAVKGTYIAYNVYAWRDSIEVISSTEESIIDEVGMKSSWEEFEKSLSFLTVNRGEIKRAFEFAWKSSIQNKHNKDIK